MNRQIKWGIVLQYGQMALNILIHLVYTPIMLKVLGNAEYGLYNLVSSIISYLSLLSLGFGSSYIRFYSRYKAKNDEESIAKLNSLYLIVFSVMGAVALVAGLFISFNCNIFFNSSYSAHDLKIAKVLMLFLTFNLAISFPASVFSSYITSQEKFIVQKLITIGKTVISPCLTIAALFMGYGSIGMVVVTTIVSLLIDIFNIVYCLGKLKMRFKLGKVESGLIKQIAFFSFFIALNQIIDQLNGQTDKIILGKMMDVKTSAVAIYSVGATIQNLYVSFSTAVSGFFTPQIHRIVNQNKPDKQSVLTNLFIKVGRVQYFVLMLVLTGFIFFGQYFISRWAGPEFYMAYYIAIVLMVPSTVPLIENIGIEIQRAENKHQFRSIVYLIIAVSNVCISIVLCKYLGIMGVVYGTLISNVIGAIIIMNIYYHTALKINILKFCKEILRASVGLIIPAVVGTIIMLYAHVNNLYMFLLYVIIYTIIYGISVYLLGLNKDERGYVNMQLKKIGRFFKYAYLKTAYFFASRLGLKNRVLFISHGGEEYSCNSKAISQKLHELYPEIKQAWVLKDPKAHDMPNYIKRIKIGSLTGIKYTLAIARSKVVVDNSDMVYNKLFFHMPKSKKQMFIQTWHGDKGIKKSFYSIPTFKPSHPFTTEKDGIIDYMLIGCQFADEVGRTAFRYKGKYLAYGTPRNDILLDKKRKEQKYFEVRKILGIPKDTKIVLYAPTFREKVSEDFEQLDVKRLIDALTKKTGDKWAFVYKAHHVNFGRQIEGAVNAREKIEDMQDLLCAGDMLITDYSSCAGDFALTGNPIIMFAYDYDQYAKSDRGMHFDLDKSPYIVAKNNDQLNEIINSYSSEEYKQIDSNILKFYNSFENGNASEKCVQVISNFLLKGDKNV